MTSLRALLVSYAFPPVGGAGVQRVLKLVKYLPQYGVSASVLTVANASVPLHDDSFARDIPATTAVVRARTLEPGYATKQQAWRASANAKNGTASRWRSRAVELGKRLLVPDPQVLWLPGAHFALARRLASSAPDDVVFISGPPFSQFLLSGLARLRRSTAVVLDYRDEWTMTSSGYEMSAATRLNAQLEALVIRQAHAITTATEEFRATLLARFPHLDPACVHAIPNGYDPDDFTLDPSSPPTDRLVLTYAGTIFRLTSASGFLTGLRRLHEREPELARLLDVRFVGRIVDTEAAHFQGSEALGVQQLGYLPHSQAVAQLAQSHVALCILDEVPGVERIYPAKIFEIMHAAKPCLALTPEGALARLVRRHALGEVVGPRDADAIARALSKLLRTFRDDGALQHAPIDTEHFDRRLLAARFAAVFRAAKARARGSV